MQSRLVVTTIPFLKVLAYPPSLDDLVLGISEPYGIAEIKAASYFLNQKPLIKKYKRFILLQAESLSIPAQNSLLKLLEEPPNHLEITLITQNLESILPTIQSRCLIKSLLSEPVITPSKSLLGDNFNKLTLASRLVAISPHQKNAAAALDFLNQEILFQRTQKPYPTHNLELLLNATCEIKQNANVVLTLNHLCIHWQT